jgi:taurine dioxygenase
MSTRPDRWTLRPLTGTFGVELIGAHVRDDVDLSWLAPLLADSGVLVIREQHLTHAEQSRFARAFGEPTPAHPVVPGHPDFPEILELDAARGGKNARWHTDVTFVATPPAASVLVADALPEVGGDTLWADLRSAYDRLSPAVQTLVDGLEAVHRITPLAYWGEPFDTALSRDDAQQLFAQSLEMPPVVHPVVRVHPVTGRRSLFVNPGFTSHIVGMSRIESEGLLHMLYQHSTVPECTVRHRWQPGDVVVWDNRATMHYATDDYGTTERRTRRITLRGDAAVGPTGLRSRVVDDVLTATR